MSEIQRIQSLLQQNFSQGQLFFDSANLLEYGRDWTRLFDPNASAIFFPLTIADVQKIVNLARENNFCLVPSGGRTGLSGSAVASKQEVVVNFARMNKILNYYPEDRSVECEPGVITESLQQFASSKNAFYPVDFAAKGSSQIGGNIATNAGGVKVLRYGSTREWVTGLKIVDGMGNLHCFNRGLIKNATGFDFRHLLIGSEGTLGFIVEATLRLTTPPQECFVFLLAIPDMQKIMQVFCAFRDHLPITAFEFFSDQALELVLNHKKEDKPFPDQSPYYVVVEIEKQNSEIEEKALQLFADLVEKGLITDGLASQNEAQFRKFWAYRENISESCAPYTPYKNDISTTIAQLPGFLREADSLLKEAYPDFKVIWFGHIGDGNLHINILKPSSLSREDFSRECEKVSEKLFSILEKYSGSISAEHGVGMLKKKFLHHSRTEAEIGLMRSVKAIFDPDQILNPGKIF